MSGVKWQGDQFLRDLLEATDFGLSAASQVVADEAKNIMPQSTPTNDARYVRGRTPRLTFRGSPPGSPPGVRTGNLRNRITTARLRYGEAWGAGTNVRYGRALEFGAQMPGGQPYLMIFGQPRFIRRSIAHRFGNAVRFTKPHYLKPRPFMRPAFERTRGGLQRVFTAAAKRRLKQSVTARAAGVR